MRERLHCVECHALLVETNLQKFNKVTITCKDCGTINVFAYNPAKYVKKGKQAQGSSLFE
jgi:RNase P subunit RPR2